MPGKLLRRKPTKRLLTQNPTGPRQGASAVRAQASQDTALTLLQDIKANRLDARDLSPEQRRACLLLVAHGSQTSAELAVLFKTCPATIRTDLKRIRQEMGREVNTWTLSEVMGHLALMAEKCSAKAMAQEDPGLAWTIARDHTKLLREFGVVEPEASEAGFKLTLEAIGSGYERARQVLAKALDPRLTGEVVDVEHHHVPAVPALPLRRAMGEDPDPGTPGTPELPTRAKPTPGPTPDQAHPQ